MKIQLRSIVLCAALVTTVGAAPFESRHDQIAKLVVHIQRADYEGDRESLKRLYTDLGPFVSDKKFGAKVRYWRGFALWRRAFNGTTASANEIEDDLALAAAEFEKAVAQDPQFTDAKIAAASCWQNISAVHYVERDMARATELMEKSFPLLKDAENAQPDNPRLLWVLGAYRFYNPPQRGGGQQLAIDTYNKGLESARRHKSGSKDVLTPSWGEPELLMSLAFSNLTQKTPNLAAAEQYAKQALALVPYWHYVKDILVPAINAAKTKAQSSAQRLNTSYASPKRSQWSAR